MSATAQLGVAWEGLSLVGDLHVPDAPGPHPAVLMMQGSGPADRASGGYFPPIRDTLLSAGLATFCFDKPGCGASTGDWRDHGLYARAAQAAAALDALMARADVDEARVGVFGHSQGGWLVQMLASSRTDLAFAISSSGPSIGMAEQHVYDCEHSMRADGWSDRDITEARAHVEGLQRAAIDGLTYDEITRDHLARIEASSWYGRYVTIDDERDWQLYRTLLTEQHDPLSALRLVRCPYLAVFGENDILVPAARGESETRSALAEAPAEDTTVVLFAGANHRLQESTEGPFVDGYLDLLARWTAERAH